MSDSTRGYLQIHSKGYLQIHLMIYLQIHGRIFTDTGLCRNPLSQSALVSPLNGQITTKLTFAEKIAVLLN